jgi:ERF superfamily
MTDNTKDLVPLYEALAKAHAKLTNPPKDKTAKVKSDRGQYEYGYASLSGVMDAVRPVLAEYGLSIVHRTYLKDTVVMLETDLVHSSGAAIDTVLPVGPWDMKPQVMGSALSYGRRYSVLNILALAPDDDDDGQIAQDAPRSPSARPAPVSRAPVATPDVRGTLDPNETDWDAKAREWIDEIDRCQTIDELHAFAAKRGGDLRLMSQHDQNGYVCTQSSWKRRLEEVKRGAPPAPPLSQHRAEQAAMPQRDGTYEKALDDELPYK